MITTQICRPTPSYSLPRPGLRSGSPTSGCTTLASGVLGTFIGSGPGIMTYTDNTAVNDSSQSLGRFVRKTLSFSKGERGHELALRLFTHQHNQQPITQQQPLP